MYTNKKGLSAIVTTLIIIGIALVAVGVVWYVLNNVITQQASTATEASGAVYQSCVEAGENLMTDALPTCSGVISYHGGQKCCSITPTA